MGLPGTQQHSHLYNNAGTSVQPMIGKPQVRMRDDTAIPPKSLSPPQWQVFWSLQGTA